MSGVRYTDITAVEARHTSRPLYERVVELTASDLHSWRFPEAIPTDPSSHQRACSPATSISSSLSFKFPDAERYAQKQATGFQRRAFHEPVVQL